MNVQLKDGYQDVEPRSVLDVLSLRNQENRDAITTIETIKEADSIKVLPDGRIFLIADGVRFIQFKLDDIRMLAKVKEYDYNFDPDSTISSIFYQKVNATEENGNEECEFMICVNNSGESVYALDLSNPIENILITEMEGKMASCIEDDNDLILLKFTLDQMCKIYLEKIEIPYDKQKVINQFALEGNVMIALEMANRLDDPSIANNIRLRNSWENSNRTFKDVDMLLKKIKDPEYIVQQ